MVGSKRRRARYRDVLAAPEWMVAEIIAGELYLSPRPAFPHARGMTSLLTLLGAPFDRGVGGPGGWFFLFEPELHLGRDVIVPDIAAWRRDRMPDVTAKFATLPPTWICEGLSQSTSKHDRARKLPLYAKAGVEFVWLVSATEWTLEVYGLANGKYELVQMFRDHDVIRAQPFEGLELRLDMIATLPSRASESPLAYGDRPIIHGDRAFERIRRYEANPAR
ncbi:MAG: Uma2 family endonuclease [Deltaproteobacteria bacterium]